MNNTRKTKSIVRSHRAALYASLALCSVTGIAQAQTAADIEAATRQAERLQTEVLERIERQREQDIQSEQPPARLSVPLPTPEPRDSDVCRDVHTVEITNATLLSASRIDTLIAPFQDQCLGVAEIERLLAAVTTAYMEKGYVAARVYLPAQDLSSGTLRIEVEEGQVERIDVLDGDKNSISVDNVAPGVVGKPLNLRDLEQALDQINRLASNNATLNILPGNTPGTSIVELRNETTKRTHVNLTYDNYGQESTGENQLGINLGLDNPLGFNDFLSLTHRRAHPYESGRQASFMNSLTYVLPFGYNTFSFSASNSEYASLLSAPSGIDLAIRGDSTIYSLRWDRVVWRGQDSTWSVSGAVTNKESNNYLEDILLAVSSRETTVADLDSSYTTRLFDGAFSFNFGMARGIPLLGGLDDADNLPDWAPRAEFFKFKYGLGYYRPFQLAGRDMTLSSQFAGQQALDTLYGSEQISIGSPFTVRGFADSSLSGDHGYYLRNDLSMRHPFVLPQGHGGILRPYVGLDYGKVWNRVDGVPEGELTSATAGLGIYFGPASLDIFHAHPIDYPDVAGDLGGSTYLNLSLAF